MLIPNVASAEDMRRGIDEAVRAMNGFARGDVVVIVAGAPPHTVGATTCFASGDLVPSIA